MCGVIAIVDTRAVNQSLYDGLIIEQHRGQDAAGIITSDGNRVYLRKDNGLVRDVFQAKHMRQLQGAMGLGHVRYPTAGCDSRAEAQPFYVNSPFGVALAHNGNLTNARQLREELFRQDLRQLNTSSDSEILLNVFAHELREAVGARNALKLNANADDVFKAMRGVYARCRGAFAAVVMVVGVGVIAFRDACGIRPLVHGMHNRAHMFASESVALDVLGYELRGDVAPGEAVFVDVNGKLHRQVCVDQPRCAPCIFEYVYLARPDSILNGIAVYRTRMNMGVRLAQRIARDWRDHDIDSVIAVPDTSRTAAIEISRVLKLPCREGFIKNRYIGRTFIMPGQAERKKSVRHKLNPIGAEFAGKNVLLVDDSIVRGTTSRKIIQLAREAGARKVYFASAAPPVRHANVYGIDMPSSAELIAHNRSEQQICAEIGADKLIYQHLDDLTDSVAQCNPAIAEFDTSCFDGNYVTRDIDAKYLTQIENERNDRAKQRAQNTQQSELLDLSELDEIKDVDERRG